jgi:hypothetical protein
MGSLTYREDDVLLPAFFTTWWLAGSDDEALSRVARAVG